MSDEGITAADVRCLAMAYDDHGQERPAKALRDAADVIERLTDELATTRDKNAKVIAAIWEALETLDGSHSDYVKTVQVSITLSTAMISNGITTAARDELSQRQWSPIETAPKDGTWIMLRFRPESFPGHLKPAPYAASIGAWSERRERWIKEESATYAFVSGDGKPTHWMPLPQNPRMNASDGIVETSPQPETRPCCGRPDQCRPAVEFKGESLAEIDNQS